jgi:HIV Tat-specific factor 1
MVRKNTAIYISGLPLDTSVDEVKDYFSLCGVIMDDLIIGGPRIKLYPSEQGGSLKGDALVVFLRPESVQLAVSLLDSSPFRPDYVIRVQPAEFHHTQGEDEKDPKEDNTSKQHLLDKETWKRRMEQMNKRLDWGEDEISDQRALQKQLDNERIVIISNLFIPQAESNRSRHSGRVSKVWRLPGNSGGGARPRVY